jgi:hypothetical protein
MADEISPSERIGRLMEHPYDEEEERERAIPMFSPSNPEYEEGERQFIALHEAERQFIAQHEAEWQTVPPSTVPPTAPPSQFLEEAKAMKQAIIIHEANLKLKIKELRELKGIDVNYDDDCSTEIMIDRINVKAIEFQEIEESFKKIKDSVFEFLDHHC